MYEPGTTTFQNTYEDADGDVLNTNPIVLDDLGSALIYGSGQYRQIVTDSLGNQIWDDLTQDLYSLITDSGGTTFDQISVSELIVTGLAIVPNVASGDNSRNIANTAFVQAAINTIPAVTFQNKIRNPGFIIQQRGTSGTITAGTPAYSIDGYILGCTGANTTWGISAGFFGTSSSLTINSVIGLTDVFIKQRVESTISATLLYAATSTVTFQSAIFNSTGVTITPTLTVNVANAADNWTTSSPILSGISLQPCVTGVWTIVCYTFSVTGAVANGIEILIDLGTSLNSSGKLIGFDNWDLRATPSQSLGLNSTPPVPEIRIYPFELLYCQRYYVQVNATTNKVIGYGFAPSSDAFEFGFAIPIQMRTLPTVIPPSASTVQINGAIVAATLINSTGNQSTQILLTFSGTTASGITSGQGLAARWGGTTGSIAASSEL